MSRSTDHRQESDGYLPLKALAAYSGLSVRTLRTYMGHPSRPLPHYRVGGKVLVKRSEFDDWMATFRGQASSSVDVLVDDVLRGVIVQRTMGVKVKFYRGAWWVFVNHHGRRRSKKVGEEAAARAVARQIRERLALGDLGVIPKDSPTVRTFATTWFTHGEGTRKRSTHRFYGFNLTLHILPVLGDKPIATLKRADCRELMAVCRAKGLKIASMRGVNRTLSAVLSQAVEDALLPANPAFRMGKYLRDGDEPAVEIQPLTREEVQQLLETAATREPVFYPFLLAALRTGMRLGELLALEWRDLDFDARVIHVRRARVAGRMTTTKNKTRRRVDMSLKLAEELRRLRTARKREALKAGTPMPETVFLTAAGEPVDGDNFRRRVFQPLLGAAKVPVVRIHDLRHTFASLLIQNGESLAYVRDQLGHSSIQVTVDIYGHLVPGANRAAVDRLDAAPIRIPGASEPEKSASGEGS